MKAPQSTRNLIPGLNPGSVFEGNGGADYIYLGFSYAMGRSLVRTFWFLRDADQNVIGSLDIEAPSA